MITPMFTSPLANEIERFLHYKRAAGCRYRSEEGLLRHLDQFLGTHLAARDSIITLDVVRAYIVHGSERSDATRENRLCLIRELCRFLAVEDPRHEIPPSRYLGIHRRPFVQRVLTREEGKRFLVACASYPPARCSPLRGIVHGTALMLLYLAGLRLGEALRLTMQDVDLPQRLLYVRKTKFGKSRLVPIASDVAQRLRECSRVVEERFGIRTGNAPFFAGPGGRPVSGNALRTSFQEILVRAGITKKGSVKRPRLHDLRGTFAVHRLLLWYERDADLDAKLPLLATYLGHVGLGSSQRYLQLTKDLLGEVVRRHQTHFGHLITDWQGGQG